MEEGDRQSEASEERSRLRLSDTVQSDKWDHVVAQGSNGHDSISHCDVTQFGDNESHVTGTSQL